MKKCVNNSSHISFLGYTISKEGISPGQVKNFVPEKDITLATDASEHSISGILS